MVSKATSRFKGATTHPAPSCASQAPVGPLPKPTTKVSSATAASTSKEEEPQQKPRKKSVTSASDLESWDHAFRNPKPLWKSKTSPSPSASSPHLSTSSGSATTSHAPRSSSSSATTVSRQSSIMLVTTDVSSKPTLVSTTTSVTPKPTLVSTTTSVTPKLAPVSTTTSVTPKLAPMSTTTSVTPKPALMSTTTSVTPKLAPMSTTTSVTPKPAPVSITTSVTPKLAPVSITTSVTPKLAPVSITTSVTPKLAPVSITTSVTPKLALVSAVTSVTPEPAPVSTTASVSPKPALVSTTTSVTPEPAPVSTTASVSPKPALVSTTTSVAFKPALVSTTTSVASKPAPMLTAANVSPKPAPVSTATGVSSMVPQVSAVPGPVPFYVGPQPGVGVVASTGFVISGINVYGGQAGQLVGGPVLVGGTAASRHDLQGTSFPAATGLCETAPGLVRLQPGMCRRNLVVQNMQSAKSGPTGMSSKPTPSQCPESQAKLAQMEMRGQISRRKRIAIGKSQQRNSKLGVLKQVTISGGPQGTRAKQMIVSHLGLPGISLRRPQEDETPSVASPAVVSVAGSSANTRLPKFPIPTHHVPGLSPPQTTFISSTPITIPSIPGAISSMPVIVSAIPPVISSFPTVISSIPTSVSSISTTSSFVPAGPSSVPTSMSAVPVGISSVPATTPSIPTALSSFPGVASAMPVNLASRGFVLPSSPAPSPAPVLSMPILTCLSKWELGVVPDSSGQTDQNLAEKAGSSAGKYAEQDAVTGPPSQAHTASALLFRTRQSPGKTPGEKLPLQGRDVSPSKQPRLLRKRHAQNAQDRGMSPKLSAQNPHCPALIPHPAHLAASTSKGLSFPLAGGSSGKAADGAVGMNHAAVQGPSLLHPDCAKKRKVQSEEEGTGGQAMQCSEAGNIIIQQLGSLEVAAPTSSFPAVVSSSIPALSSTIAATPLATDPMYSIVFSPGGTHISLVMSTWDSTGAAVAAVQGPFPFPTQADEVNTPGPQQMKPLPAAELEDQTRVVTSTVQSSGVEECIVISSQESHHISSCPSTPSVCEEVEIGEEDVMDQDEDQKEEMAGQKDLREATSEAYKILTQLASGRSLTQAGRHFSPPRPKMFADENEVMVLDRTQSQKRPTTSVSGQSSPNMSPPGPSTSGQGSHREKPATSLTEVNQTISAARSKKGSGSKRGRQRSKNTAPQESPSPRATRSSARKKMKVDQAETGVQKAALEQSCAQSSPASSQDLQKAAVEALSILRLSGVTSSKSETPTPPSKLKNLNVDHFLEKLKY